jgi:hypothetical protein
MFDFGVIFQSILAALTEALAGSLVELISGLFGGLGGTGV